MEGVVSIVKKIWGENKKMMAMSRQVFNVDVLQTKMSDKEHPDLLNKDQI